ncbi:hypothetical protein TWF694_008103 [Orbilia ellipsospora]|uniref:non-specific serine/threonine protein kinase n=1 Tax=Orbilia ellipsospora TaxID=2528407 RepID=A0AAV9XIF7_9PEZI
MNDGPINKLSDGIIGSEVLTRSLILVAILNFLGVPYLIHPIYKRGVKDTSLSNVETVLKDLATAPGADDYFPGSKFIDDIETPANRRIRKDLDAFNKYFKTTVKQFRLPRFSHEWDFIEFKPDDILPIENQKLRGSGGFGQVYSFNVYKSYCDIEPDAQPKLYARKRIDRRSRTVRPKESDRLEKNSEHDSLLQAQKFDHRNIVKFICAFEEERYLNFIFEYAEFTLQDYFEDNKEKIPPDLNTPDNNDIQMQILEGWLWKGIEGVISAVKTIHDDSPAKIGIHKDLKPSNILIRARDLQLLVTDFGLSYFTTRVPSKEYITSGSPPINTGRSGMYAPPIPASDPRHTTYFDYPELQIGRESPKYDIWSLGCIMAEVLVFLVGYARPVGYSGSKALGPFQAHEAVKQFRKDRAEEDRGYGRFYFANRDVGESKRCTAFELALAKIETDAERAANRYLSGLVSIIKDMTKIVPSERPAAFKIVDEIEKLKAASREREQLSVNSGNVNIFSIWRNHHLNFAKLTSICTRSSPKKFSIYNSLRW